MRLEALVLSRDPEALRLLRRVLPDLGIGLVLCAVAAEAEPLLKRRKFDALVIDCDLAGAAETLQQLRQGGSNRSCIVFALVPPGTAVRRAFELGANFVLEKPLSLDRTMRGFRAGHGLMVREARRYYRCRTETPVTLDFGAGLVQRFLTINLSEGGLAIRTPRRLSVGSAVTIALDLPHGLVIEAQGEITWSTPDGRAGVRILSMADVCREELTAWLAQAFEREEAAGPGLYASSPLPELGRHTVQ